LEPDKIARQYSERRPAYLFGDEALDERDVYNFPDGRQLRILRGNLATQHVEAIVSSDDLHLSMGGGVSWAIRNAGGPSIRHEARRLTPVRPGRAAVTTAGKLPARFVFHGVTLGGRRQEKISRDLIAEIVKSCFYHADTFLVRSMAFPLLGTGVGGFSREVCLDTIFSTISRNLTCGITPLKEVRIVLPDREARLQDSGHPAAADRTEQEELPVRPEPFQSEHPQS
jgi:eukaryotic-like serine/threonine-protein kinase